MGRVLLGQIIDRGPSQTSLGNPINPMVLDARRNNHLVSIGIANVHNGSVTSLGHCMLVLAKCTLLHAPLQGSF